MISGALFVAPVITAGWELAVVRVPEGVHPQIARLAFDLGNLSFASGWVALGSFAVAAGWAAPATRTLPRWLSWWAIALLRGAPTPRSQIAGSESNVTWSLTFGWILLPGVISGALLGWAEHLRRTGGRRGWRWLALSPLVLASVLFSQPGDIAGLLEDGVGGGALAVPLFGMAGGYALSLHTRHSAPPTSNLTWPEGMLRDQRAHCGRAELGLRRRIRDPGHPVAVYLRQALITAWTAGRRHPGQRPRVGDRPGGGGQARRRDRDVRPRRRGRDVRGAVTAGALSRASGLFADRRRGLDRRRRRRRRWRRIRGRC